jgi:hypothetical protein
MRVEIFYDRPTRCWWVRRVDENGDQMGAAEHVYTKREAEALARQMEAANA